MNEALMELMVKIGITENVIFDAHEAYFLASPRMASAFSDADAVGDCKIAFHAFSFAGMTYRFWYCSEMKLPNGMMLSSTTIVTPTLTKSRHARERATATISLTSGAASAYFSASLKAAP
jgi:hypothetical protein